MAQRRKLLGEILQEMQVVSAAQVRAALQLQMQDSGKKLGEILIEQGVLTNRQLVEALARQFGYPFVDLRKLPIDRNVAGLLPRNVCEEHGVIPIRENGKVVVLAISDPLDLFTLDNVIAILGRRVSHVLAPREDIQEAIVRVFGKKEQSQLQQMIEEATVTATDIQIRADAAVTPLESPDADDAPVIRLIQLMISEAVKGRSSDIHVEPMADRVRIRYRVDGICHEANAAPKHIQASLLSRIKIMAGMDIAEKRKPQDGRIRLNVNGRELDIRVSALPAIHGESIVMRLLDRQVGLVSLEELGFHPTDLKRFNQIIRRPNGIFLITGPTGSGKTTTLYAALRELNRPDVKIITAENPVEYHISGINQSMVHEKIGLTFARILRAMLRQAPNIILVGEIRDSETAEIAIQAALTGHLVFSTLHTNDAPSALARLLDMGVKPFLVASAVQAVMAQRLVRVLCPRCREPDINPDPAALVALNLSRDQLKGKIIYRAKGCDQCNNTGYRGRKGIFELMELDSALREMVFRKEPVAKMRQHAIMRGMVTLMEDGKRKVMDGITSLEEVMSITHREDIGY